MALIVKTALLVSPPEGATPETQREARVCSIALHAVFAVLAPTHPSYAPEDEAKAEAQCAQAFLSLASRLMELFPQGGFAVLRETLDHVEARGLHLAPWLDCEGMVQ